MEDEAKYQGSKCFVEHEMINRLFDPTNYNFNSIDILLYFIILGDVGVSWYSRIV